MNLRGIKQVVVPLAAIEACAGQTISIDGREFLATKGAINGTAMLLLLPLRKERTDKAAE